VINHSLFWTLLSQVAVVSQQAPWQLHNTPSAHFPILNQVQEAGCNRLALAGHGLLYAIKTGRTSTPNQDNPLMDIAE